MMRRVILSLVLGLLLGGLLIACNRGNTPEGVVKGYIEAINAENAEKALSYISPDLRGDPYSYLDPVRDINDSTKYYEVSGTIVGDFDFSGTKIVTVIATKSSRTWGTKEGRWSFLVEKIDGRW